MENTHAKMSDYASMAQEEDVKKLFYDAADCAMKNKQQLMNLKEEFSGKF